MGRVFCFFSLYTRDPETPGDQKDFGPCGVGSAYLQAMRKLFIAGLLQGSFVLFCCEDFRLGGEEVR
jgi:hypothetical protein